jgi:hypothetical protein
MRLSVVLILFLLSCSQRTTPVDTANKFEIIFLDRRDSIVHTGTTQHFINAFSDVLRSNSEKVSCDSSGIIRFFHDDSLLYKTYFTTEVTSGLEGCEFALDGKSGKRLTYVAGMYIDEVYQKLKN